MADLPHIDNGENFNTTQKRNLTIEEIRANIKRSKAGVANKQTDLPTATLSAARGKAASSQTGHTGASRDTAVSQQPPVRVSNLTNEEHAGSGAPPNRQPGRRTKPREAAPKDPLATTESTQQPDKYVDLANLCEEILTYCHLLDHSRNNTVAESLSLRETVRELERLLDSARQREASHLSDVDMHRDAMTTFEKRYYSLKARAKTHIKECQDDRDRIKAELDLISAKMKTAEGDLYEAQSLVHSQQVELDRLREQTKSLPSEKEINNMSIRLRKLEDENGRLATERNKLLNQLDAVHGGKRDDGRGSIRGEVRGKREAELEAALERLSQEIGKRDKQIADLEKENHDYHEYCEVLLEKCGTS